MESDRQALDSFNNDMWDKKTTFVSKFLREWRPMHIMD